LAKGLTELESLKNAEIVTICRSGGRSHTAAQILMQAGFQNVRGLMGGMTAWKQAGHPTA
jgi:rhodanese-related sulfurtransferase